MNNARRITATAIMALLVFLIWSSVTHSQDEPGRRRLPDEGSPARKSLPARSEPTPPESPAQPDTPELPNPQTNPGAMSAQEKLVRDVYARLMRYQSAARDELAARNGLSSEPDDYLTFELRHIHTGPIEEIYYRPLTEMVTGTSGATINLTPTHLSNGNDPAHAYYAAEWSQPDIDADRDDPTFESASRQLKRSMSNDEEPLYPVDQSYVARTNTVGEMLRKGGERYARVEKYTSYEVTVHLDGKQRTYNALVLYFNQNASKRKEDERANPENAPDSQLSAEVLDNVTSEMNTVLNDEAPRVQSPWSKYINTSLYAAVTRTIRATKAAGRPLRPADAPIGYLPGDDVTASKKDMQSLTVNQDCLHIDIKKADDSPLPTPFRIGITANGHDRTQHLKAVVFPQAEASNVTISVSTNLTLSNVSAPSNGVITFDVVGNTKSQNRGDASIAADHSSDFYFVQYTASVVVPSQIATPHDTNGGGVVVANRVLDATTSPFIGNLPPGDVLLATTYGRVLTITVWDQFGEPIGDIYQGAAVSEDDPSGGTHPLNQLLTAASTYSDPVGTAAINSVVTAGSPDALAWPSQPQMPLTLSGSFPATLNVYVDGFLLNPAIVSRTLTFSPPNSVTITWP